MELKHYSSKDNIEILGHIFNGLEDIEASVEVMTRISNSIGDRYIQRITPVKNLKGLHILKLYEPYPCFDSSDWLYENRKYCNYFFSTEPFTDETINRFADTNWTDNYCLIHEGMDEKMIPSIYYGGSSWNDLIVVTHKH